jgi:hypothetical protein
MREMQTEIAALRRQLAAAAATGGQPSLPRTPEQAEALATEFEQRVRLEVAARAEAVQKQEEAARERAVTLQAEIKALREQNLALQQSRLTMGTSGNSSDFHREGEGELDQKGQEQWPCEPAGGTPSGAVLEDLPRGSLRAGAKTLTSAAGASHLGPIRVSSSGGRGSTAPAEGGYADVPSGDGEGFGAVRGPARGQLPADRGLGGWDGRGGEGAALRDVSGETAEGSRPPTEIRGDAGPAELEPAARRSRRRPTSRRASRYARPLSGVVDCASTNWISLQRKMLLFESATMVCDHL